MLAKEVISILNLYIDESGSMTIYPKQNGLRYFHIAIVNIKKGELAKKRFKKFISKNFERLAELDEMGKMFVSGSFKELKGSCLNFELKKQFVQAVCYDEAIEVYLVRVDNRKVKSYFYQHRHQAFNFLIKTTLMRYAQWGLLGNEQLELHLDQRNLKKVNQSFLKEYLQTELVSALPAYADINVEYLSSEHSVFIQIADVFANLHYTSNFSSEVGRLIRFLIDEGYVKDSFEFDISSGFNL